MKKLDITREKAEQYIADGGETAFWCIAPSEVGTGRRHESPSYPDGYELFDQNPEWDMSKYWFIRRKAR